MDQPLLAMRDGKVRIVPLLIGTTLDEMRYWSEADGLPLEKRGLDVLRQQLSSIAGANPSQLIDMYIKDKQNPGEGILALLTDGIFRVPVIRFAEANTAHKPTWMYLFTYRSTALGKKYGAAHAMELPFVFGGLDRLDIIAFTGADNHREQLMNGIQDAWINFDAGRIPAILACLLGRNTASIVAQPWNWGSRTGWFTILTRANESPGWESHSMEPIRAWTS